MGNHTFADLAKEIETVMVGSGINYLQIIDHINTLGYERGLLVQELKDAKLGYFANKIVSGYYDIEQVQPSVKDNQS